MKILVTGANGFVGKNLVAALNNIKDGKDRTHPAISIEEIYSYDIDSSAELLEEACKNADFRAYPRTFAERTQYAPCYCRHRCGWCAAADSN